MAWKTHVLAVANRTADSDELAEALRSRAAEGPVSFTLLVPASQPEPASPSSPRELAAERLERALERLRGEGLEVEGLVGDADPIAAVREAWSPDRYDEVIVSTLPVHASRWLGIDLPHRVARITDAPVRHVVARERAPASPR